MRTLDTGTDDLLASVDAGVATLTMNRPARRNALSPAMLDALARLLAAVEVDDEVGCVVLTGAGEAFCAGGDVRAMDEGYQDEGYQDEGDQARAAVPFDVKVHRQRLSQRATSGAIWSMPKPVIASIPGPAAGAGLSLALACDLRYAADTAVLTTAFAKVGFSGDYGGTWFLTQIVGTAKARELYYFSDRLSATEAARLGVVSEVFPAAELAAEVDAKARRLAAGPRVAHRYMKEALNRAVTGELVECLDLEASFHNHTGRTEDHQEAARAFVEKRPPVFRGR
ncbi:MAG: 2-(1,2-epoxy,2-dihydrophenyl)acetyl-CoA isomerase [Frankiaceae bacterium]|nr:2-(1,2-epoxy,2-dihydrophenyl)acetyl-CoA isomerase [Frankiaceae bacterium]